MKTKKFNLSELSGWAPVIGLILMVIVFIIATGGKIISVGNLRVLMNQIVITAIAAIGGVYAFSCGALDMSMGGSVCVSAIIAALVGIRTGSFVLLVISCMGSAVLLGIVKSLLVSYLRIPAYILTIVLNMALSSLGLVLMGNETNISVAEIVPEGEETVIYIVVLAIFYILALVIFNYYPLGKKSKAVGGNPQASFQMGIQINKTMLAAFIMCAVSVGLAAIVTILRTQTVSSSTAGSLGTDMMVAIVLGGMPLTGGAKSKISASLIGSAIITILNNGLSILGLGNGEIQMVRGILFLTVIFITGFSYRTKLLPR